MVSWADVSHDFILCINPVTASCVESESVCATVLCTCVCERVHVLEIVATIFLFEKVRKCHVDRIVDLKPYEKHEAKTSKSACRLSGEGQLHKSQARTNHTVLSDP